MAACSTACRAPGSCGRSTPAAAAWSAVSVYQKARVTSVVVGRSSTSVATSLPEKLSLRW
jgi:hypothetical protein